MALTKGHTFTSGEIVTPAKLNSLVDDATIPNGTITTDMLADDAVTADKLASGAVTADATSIGADDLTDVDTSTAAPTDGQVLAWNDADSKWKPTNTGSGGGTTVTDIDDLSDVDTSTTAPTDGQALLWDNANSKWEPGDVPSGGTLTARAACTVTNGVLDSGSTNIASVSGSTMERTVTFTSSISSPIPVVTLNEYTTTDAGSDLSPIAVTSISSSSITIRIPYASGSSGQSWSGDSFSVVIF